MYIITFFLAYSYAYNALSNMLNASIEEEIENNQNINYRSICEIFMKNPEFNIFNIKLMTNISHEENLTITSKNVIFRFEYKKKNYYIIYYPICLNRSTIKPSLILKRKIEIYKSNVSFIGISIKISDNDTVSNYIIMQENSELTFIVKKIIFHLKFSHDNF